MASTMPPIAVDRVEVGQRARPPCRASASRRSTSRRADRRRSATPLSCAMICCVRSASVAASAVGSASASSSELVCSEFVPPSTADSACSAVRTTLLYGCCAVSDTPAVWRVEAQLPRPLAPARRTGRASPRAQICRAARYLAISSKKSLCALKKNEMRGTNVVDVEPGVDAPLDVLDAVAQRERQFLQRRRARLADVIAADRDRVPLRHLARRRTRRCR